MNVAKNKIAVLVLFILGIQLFGCGPAKQKIKNPDIAYAPYVSGFTSGMVNRDAEIRIELSEDKLDSVALEKLRIQSKKDSTVLTDLFEFSPAIEGKAVWINKRTLEFIPKEALPHGQFYNCLFKLDEVSQVEKGLEEFQFQFSTYQQKVYVNVYGVKNYNYYEPELQYLDGYIQTTDAENIELLKQVLSATQESKSLNIRLESTYDDNRFYFVVDSIERSTKASQVIVKWNGKAIQSFSKGKHEEKIAPLGDFTVSSAKVIDNGDQFVELAFTTPLQPNQNLNGIITLEGSNQLSFSITNNYVKVYIPNWIVGVKKLIVSTGIKNRTGHNMLETFETSLYFEEPKPLVRIKGNGSILPDSKGLIFPFEAVSLKAVDVRIIKIFEQNIHHFLQVNNLNGEDELTRFGKVVAQKKIRLDYDKTMNLKQWNWHVIDLSKLIKPDPGAIYRVSIKFNKAQAICDCDVDTITRQEREREKDNWSENLWHPYGFDGGYDSWNDYYENESVCSDNYYYGKAVNRNILASNIGMIYKLDESKRSHAFINDMLTTKPISKVKITYFSYAKEIIASGYTDTNGMLDIHLKEKPFLMVAEHQRQRGYLKLTDGWTNSLSKFDIQGQEVQKGVKGFIYGERGVWRPGDSLYLNFILENKDHSLPANHPISFELFSPEGQLVESRIVSKNTGGIYDLRTALSSEAPTGNYSALVKIGNNNFTKNIKIETVKPNRLKIYLDMDRTNPTDSFVTLSSKWLHGAIAKNLKANVHVAVKSKTTSFKAFENYTFDSPLRYFVTNDELIFEGNLDEKGEAKIQTKINTAKDAPGMLHAVYTTKVFEKGGSFSIDRCSRTYSPYSTYVGIELPYTKNADHSLETDKKNQFKIACVDEAGNLKKTNRLEVKIYRLNWQWWYENQSDQGSNFISANGAFVIKDTLISAVSGKTNYTFEVDKHNYGRFLITVTDLDGNHQSGKIFTVDWPYHQRGNRGGNEHANLLNFTTDKANYNTGEKIKLSIPSPENGRALISIETRSKVIKKYWITTQKGETIHELTATKDMAPNAFIHLTLLQAHASTQNDLPIRLYGIVPVVVEDPKTHLHPIIASAEEIRPNSKTNIKISEKTGRSMTYTLAIVDDGLLDLTRFQTPNPWQTFYAKEALGIKTWDMYDDVIGAYAGKLDKLLSIGGDEGLNEGKGNKANRFKPMVIHLGVFHLKANEVKNHSVEIPNYLGSVRIMVVARDEESYGSAEKQVKVNQPLMIISTLPRVVGPTEEIVLPVNVFAMKSWIKDVQVSVETNSFFELIGSHTQTVKFEKEGDEVLNFKLKVASNTGIAKVSIKAVSGKEICREEIEIDVRSPNPMVYESSNYTLEPGKSANASILFSGIKGTNAATVEFSTIPSFGLEKRLGYLMNYPHGCIEQTTSSVFPQLYLSNLLDLTEKQKQEVTRNIQAGINRIQLFQTMNGGFSYWPGEGNDSDWGTNYAGHFLLSAEKSGYKISQNLKTKWLKYQKEQALNWQKMNDSYPKRARLSQELIQAYRLYVLALANQAELGAMNRLREERGISEITKWRLAAAYELAGQHEIAIGLVKNLSLQVENYRELYGSYGSGFRDQAMIIETLSLLNEKTRAKDLMYSLLEAMGSESWLSTQETAYGLLAVCAYTGINNSASEMKFSLQLNEQVKLQTTSKKNVMQVNYTEKDILEKGKLRFINQGKSTLFVKVIVAGQPLIGDTKKSEKGLEMQVNYFNMNHETIDPKKIKQGTEFYAEVKLKNNSTKHYKEMALNQIFPSCWEIHNDRMGETESNQVTDYQDIRDDRVFSYYQLKPGETKMIKVKLNATFLGKCYLPTLYSEAMYDHAIYSKIPGMWVEVVD